MIGESETIRQALEALSAICRPTTKPLPVRAPEPLPRPRNDLDAWREPVAEWLESECVQHWKCHSSVTSLHQAYCEWDVSHGFPPCNRETFGELLQEAGFLMADKLLSGLILRADLAGLCGYPHYAKLLADVRPIRRSEFPAQCARQ